MTDLNVKKHHELYSYQMEYYLGREEMSVYDLIEGLESSEIVVPSNLKKFAWSIIDVKNLIISLFKGVPIGEFIFWRLRTGSHFHLHCQTIFDKPEKLTGDVKLILDGFQRCLALAAVFSEENLVIEHKLRKVILYYNPFQDAFKFEGEIEQLDKSWLLLKNTYSSDRFDSKPQELYEAKIRLTLEKLRQKNPDHYEKVRERIKRAFGVVNKQLTCSLYTGNNPRFTSDLVYFRNTWKANTSVQIP